MIGGRPANKWVGMKLLLMDAGCEGILRRKTDNKIFGHDSPH